MNHAALLHNKASGRFHPILFRPSPRPSDEVKPGLTCRHRSFGHHTEGFASRDEANAFIAQDESLLLTNIVLFWDGKDMPATTIDLPLRVAPEEPGHCEEPGRPDL